MHENVCLGDMPAREAIVALDAMRKSARFLGDQLLDNELESISSALDSPHQVVVLSALKMIKRVSLKKDKFLAKIIPLCLDFTQPNLSCAALRTLDNYVDINRYSAELSKCIDAHKSSMTGENQDDLNNISVQAIHALRENSLRFGGLSPLLYDRCLLGALDCMFSQVKIAALRVVASANYIDPFKMMLRTRVNDPDPHVAATAVWVMGNAPSGVRIFIDEIVDASVNPHSRVVRESVFVAARCLEANERKKKDPLAAGLLSPKLLLKLNRIIVNGIRHPSNDVYDSAYPCVTMLADKSPFYHDMFSDMKRFESDPERAVAALCSLQNVGMVEALEPFMPLLMQILDGDNTDVSVAAVRAVVVQERYLSGEHPRYMDTANTFITAALNHPDKNVVSAALYGLSEATRGLFFGRPLGCIFDVQRLLRAADEDIQVCASDVWDQFKLSNKNSSNDGFYGKIYHLHFQNGLNGPKCDVNDHRIDAGAAVRINLDALYPQNNRPVVCFASIVGSDQDQVVPLYVYSDQFDDVCASVHTGEAVLARVNRHPNYAFGYFVKT